MDVLWKATPEDFLSSPHAPAFPYASTHAWAPYDVGTPMQMHVRTSMKVSLLSSEGLRGPKQSALVWGSRPSPALVTPGPSPPPLCSYLWVVQGEKWGGALLGLSRSLTLSSFMLTWLLSWALRESRDRGKGNTQRALSICVNLEGSNVTDKTFLFCWCYQILVYVIQWWRILCLIKDTRFSNYAFQTFLVNKGCTSLQSPRQESPRYHQPEEKFWLGFLLVAVHKQSLRIHILFLSLPIFPPQPSHFCVDLCFCTFFASSFCGLNKECLKSHPFRGGGGSFIWM